MVELLINENYVNSSPAEMLNERKATSHSNDVNMFLASCFRVKQTMKAISILIYFNRGPVKPFSSMLFL